MAWRVSRRSLRPIISSTFRKPQLRHQLAHFLGDELEEVDDVLGPAAELFAQARVLSGDADGAGIEVADAHHDAAHDHQGGGREPELLGPEQGGDHDVAARLQLAVGLDDDPAPKIVQNQGLLGLGQPQLPGDTGVLDRGERAGARASVVAADQHHVAVGLGHARRDGPHPHLGDELDADPRSRIAVLQVVDQLGEIFNRVDVVVGRRADQPDSGGRVPDLGDPGPDLVAGELPALAGLGALGHLDLKLEGAHQVFAGDAEPGRGDLLDGALAGIAAG